METIDPITVEKTDIQATLPFVELPGQVARLVLEILNYPEDCIDAIVPPEALADSERTVEFDYELLPNALAFIGEKLDVTAAFGDKAYRQHRWWLSLSEAITDQVTIDWGSVQKTTE